MGVASSAFAFASRGGVLPRDPDRATVLCTGADLQSINPLVAVHPLAKQVQNHVLFLTLAARDSALRPVRASPRGVGRRAHVLRLPAAGRDLARRTADDGGRCRVDHRARPHPAVAYPRASELRDLAAVVRETRSPWCCASGTPAVVSDVLTTSPSCRRTC